MLLDDIVDQERVNSQNSRDNVWSWFGRQLSVLDPGCEMILIGTRWHWDDPYTRVQKQLKKYEEDKVLGWWTEKRKAIEAGRIIFPTRFTKEALEEIKRVQGDYIFSCFYFNEPVGEGTNPYDLRKFKWVPYVLPDETDHPVDKIQTPFTHIYVDPAVSEADHACFSGIVIADALYNRRVVVRECILEKLHPDALLDRIFELVQIHDPVRVLIEDEAYQKSLCYWAKREMANRNIFFQVLPIKIPRNVQRNYRLSALQPFVHSGQICFYRHMPGKKLLIEEFETFPKGPHRDLLCALSMVPFGTMYPPHRKLKEPEPELPAAFEFLEKLIQRGRRVGGYMPRVRVKGVLK
jgi:hypothetical protein